MNIYKLIWRFGKEEYVLGDSITNACNQAGIGNGALRALDYWEEVSEIPDQLKHFEIIPDSSEIHNKYFIEQLKKTGFNNGSITEINFANRKFTYQFVGKSPTAYQYKKV